MLTLRLNKFVTLISVLMLSLCLDHLNAATGSANDSEAILPAKPAPKPRKPVRGWVEGTLPGPRDEPIQWRGLMKSSTIFLGMMHAFRLATEPGTREGLKGPFFQGYADSLGALHGWSDGDPFLVNYIGHPMQGAVSGYMLIQHDPKFQTVQFGRSSQYWKSRLRAAAYAWAFSEQFEVGPMSEASIGNVQALYPAYGFVDHVITPVVGTGWIVLEDVLDKYVVRNVERRTDNQWLRIMARVGLNPSRSMANVLSRRAPWRRDDRPTVYWDYEMEDRLLAAGKGAELFPETPAAEIPTAELTVQPHVLWYNAGRSDSTVCVGGGGVGQWNFSRNWSLVADVGGCKMLGWGENLSGDSLTYLFGPQWNGRNWRKLTPRVRFLIGGNKITQEELLPDKIKELEDQGINWKENEYHSIVANEYDQNAFAFLVGGGFDLTVHPALSLQLANLDYMYTGLGEFRGRRYTHNVSFTFGVTLRVGTW